MIELTKFSPKNFEPLVGDGLYIILGLYLSEDGLISFKLLQMILSLADPNKQKAKSFVAQKNGKGKTNINQLTLSSSANHQNCESISLHSPNEI